MIARRRLIDLLRKRELPVGGDQDLSTVTDSQPSVVEQLEVTDEAARAAEILSRLPDDQQQVIRLSVYDGLSHSRIAEATGLSLGTVKTHIRRGMLKIRQALFGEITESAQNAMGLSAGEVVG